MLFCGIFLLSMGLFFVGEGVENDIEVNVELVGKLDGWVDGYELKYYGID